MAFFGTVEIIKDRVKVVTKEMITNRKCKTCILPDSVEIIGDEAFKNCSHLTKLIFINEKGKIVNNKIVRIGAKAFYRTGIRKFIYSHHLQAVGSDAFSYSPISIFQYQDDNNMESELEIIEAAFCGTKIKTLVVPPSLKKIDIWGTLVSLVCKDKDGNITKISGSFSNDLISWGIYNLQEISLVEDYIFNIQKVIDICSNLKKIYIGVEKLNGNSLLDIFGREINFTLCGETEVLNSFVEKPDYNTITVTFNAKVKKIKKEFFNGLANYGLNIPEGVEEIEGFPNNLRNLRELVLPSTLKKINNPTDINDNEKRYSIKVSIYANIGEDSYKNLCSYLEPSSSTIIIKGNHFTKEQREWFQNLSPDNLKLKFVEDSTLNIEATSDSIKEDTNNPKISMYQKSVDGLKLELMELRNLMPEDLKIKIQKKYNQIIDEYQKNRIQEKESILNNSFSIGLVDSSVDLYTRLVLLQTEIVANQNAIVRLKEISKYKNILEDSIETKNDSIDSIEKIVQNINFEIHKLHKIYQKLITDRVIQVLSQTESKYQEELKIAFEDSPVLHSESNHMVELQSNLESILKMIENPTVQECMDLENAFEQKSSSMDIHCLKDNISTMNYVVDELTNSHTKDEWKHLKYKYGELFYNSIYEVIKEEKTEEDMKKLKEKFTNELSKYVDDTSLVSKTDLYRLNKKEEVKNIMNFFSQDDSDKKEIKHTVSALLMKDIMSKVPDLNELRESYDLEYIVKQEIEKVITQLNKADSCESIDEIMQQFYQTLTDIWEKVCSINDYNQSEIMIKKLELCKEEKIMIEKP